MEEKQDSRIIGMRERVLAAVAALTLLVSRFRGNEKELEKIEARLATARQEHAQHESARQEIEGLSAVGLHRRGLKPEAAVAQADEAQGKADAAGEREAQLSAERDRIAAQLTADRVEIENLLPDLAFESSLLGEGEFVAELGAMIDLRAEHVPTLTAGTTDRLFAKTRAHQIYHDRNRRVNAGADRRDGIALAEEILAEPIVAIRQRPPALPHPNNSVLVRSIEQRLGLAPAIPSAPPFGKLPGGATSAERNGR